MMKKVIFIILIQFSGCTAPKSTYQTEDLPVIQKQFPFSAMLKNKSLKVKTTPN